MNRQEHWDQVYQNKAPSGVSWHQDSPKYSLALITSAEISKHEGILDVGGGASVLVDTLLAEGYADVTVLDISSTALDHAETRLGRLADKVSWMVADATDFDAKRTYAVWHDRAVFHFLVEPDDRRRYLGCLRKALVPGGQVIMGTFAPDGPLKCSGFEVQRYDSAMICAELGSDFELLEEQTETHRTPWESEQRFNWFRFKFNGRAVT